MSDSRLSHSLSKTELIRQRDNWQETARLHCSNEEYYRGLLDEIGNIIGDQAFIADDGSRQQDVIRAKLPELVLSLKKDVRVGEVCNGRIPITIFIDPDEGLSWTTNPEKPEYVRIGFYMGKEFDVKMSPEEFANLEKAIKTIWEARQNK